MYVDACDCNMCDNDIVCVDDCECYSSQWPNEAKALAETERQLLEGIFFVICAYTNCILYIEARNKSTEANRIERQLLEAQNNKENIQADAEINSQLPEGNFFVSLLQCVFDLYLYRCAT